MARAKKVYYDILLQGTSASQVVNLANADRYGNTLATLAALTYGADGLDKARRELTAVFVPGLITSTLPTGFSGGPTVAFMIDWMRNNTLPAPYLTAGGASVPTKQGMTSIYLANPRVRVAHTALTNRTYRGTLHVQRQHSIEA
jgi:hypothetical protein